jgi:hypothetical protein
MGAEDQTSFEESFPLSMLCKESELSRRMLINASTGKSRPHPHNHALLLEILRRIGLLC